jgi:phosphoadenosine phosphosulfate reductase
VAWAADRFGDGFVVAASMADAVLAHLVASVRPGATVLFLDTGYHFAETLGTRDAVAAGLPVTVRTVSAALTRAEHEAEFGRLHATDPDLCCKLRKVWPLDQALRGASAWASGARRSESASRASLPVVGWDQRRGLVKLNPLATWTDDDVHRYAVEHGVLVNPLRQLGYASIGCAPCTRPVADGEDARAGRWAGSAKTECGIHT